MEDCLILYTTWPDAETAEAAGRAAVEAKLAACANLLAPMTAIYRWEGRIQRETETAMLLKTTGAAAPGLRDFILARHPYATPCVVAWPCDPAGSNPAFVRWIGAEIA
jgi:periplasmic divalent cation tolerance protein